MTHASRRGRLAGLALLGLIAVASPALALAQAQAPATVSASTPAANATGPAAAPAAAPATASTVPSSAAPAPQKTDTGDTAWMLTATALVLMMTVPGLALFYGGMVRRKNVIATVAQSFAITAIVTVCWAVAGYSLAFTTGGDAGANRWIGGLGRVFLNGISPVPESRAYTVAGAANTIPEYVFMTYQMTFAIITPALVCGAFAERFKFSALCLFTALWSLLVYAPIAHWVWGGGILGGLGVLDFAGGTVVHVNAGVAGLVCALVVGPRIGLGRENMAPFNLVYTLIG
ncbi:MAG: ammonium transporter, partial [Caulobacteraceae bacterium]|nr:ammonium transporter [Caulobacter sp.]